MYTGSPQQAVSSLNPDITRRYTVVAISKGGTSVCWENFCNGLSFARPRVRLRNA